MAAVIMNWESHADQRSGAFFSLGYKLNFRKWILSLVYFKFPQAANIYVYQTDLKEFVIFTFCRRLHNFFKSLGIFGKVKTFQNVNGHVT